MLPELAGGGDAAAGGGDAGAGAGTTGGCGAFGGDAGTGEWNDWSKLAGGGFGLAFGSCGWELARGGAGFATGFA